MHAILNSSIALRSWQRIPYAYVMQHSGTPKSLSREEFETLLLADGKTEIPETETARRLLEIGFMTECGKGESSLSKWQQYKKYDNRLMPSINIQITGRCNYNCLHCFNAKDNHALQSHMTLEQITGLLNQAADCGIRAVTITGGEPMVHKNIREIISATYERDMYVYDFNTNGYYITQDFLDFMKSFGYPTTMKISFDGIGFHDEMRGFKGAEKYALKAMELCIKNGFSVMAQVNVNKNNVDSIPETMELLDSMGVGIIRLIRTTEVPRWLKNGGQCLEIGEYYDSMLKTVSNFIKKPRRCEIVVWQFLQVHTSSKTYSCDAVKELRMSQPICRGNRGMIAVGANGNVFPCLQISGIIEATGVKFGNVFETPLKDILQTESDYMQSVCMSVEEKAAVNGKCSKCKFLKYCGTGCPALSATENYARRGTFCLTNPDSWKCYFWENGYYEKMLEAMKEFECISPRLETSEACSNSVVS